MKKIIVFIGLKIVEIFAFCGLMYWFWWSGGLLNKWQGISHMDDWYNRLLSGLALSFGFIVIVGLALFCCAGIYKLIEANWKWTNKILRKLK